MNNKYNKLYQAYTSENHLQQAYDNLHTDTEFIEMLCTTWKIKSFNSMFIKTYYYLIVYRNGFICTDTGYQLPTVDEDIKKIRSFFDPKNMICICVTQLWLK